MPRVLMSPGRRRCGKCRAVANHTLKDAIEQITGQGLIGEIAERRAASCGASPILTTTKVAERSEREMLRSWAEQLETRP